MAEKWMQKAFANAHGQLRGKLGAKKGKNISSSKLNAAAKKGGKLGKQARLAKTARKIAAKRRK
jgi:hypothetical protein